MNLKGKTRVILITILKRNDMKLILVKIKNQLTIH
jgi:hypothetical protein